MKEHKIYIIAITVLVILISLLIFSDQDSDKGSDEVLLWDKNWSAIEYDTFRYEKEKDLSEDIYYVFQKSASPEVKSIKRRGSYILPGIFNYWNRPEIKGFYDKSMIESVKGVSLPSKEIHFFSGGGTNSDVYVRLLKRLPSGDMVIETNDSAYNDRLIILGQENFTSLDTYRENMYEKRLFVYPGSSYTEEIEMDAAGSPDGLLKLTQEQKQTETNLNKIWKNGAGKEIPVNLADTLDGNIRQLQIEKFGDENGSFTGMQKLWDGPGEEYRIEISKKFDGEQKILLKKINQNGIPAVLVKHDDYIDYINANQLDRLISAFRGIKDFEKSFNKTKSTDGPGVEKNN